jgi:thiamine pyrophosphate-dependent acetolactate synthase large subunit-like protein
MMTIFGNHGYAQATRRPALVNLRTGAGLGNAWATC